MTVQIYYKNSPAKKTSGNLILFVNEKFDIKGLKTGISKSESLYISDLLKTSDLKKNILVFELNSKRKIILVSIKKDTKNSKIENLGAELYGRINLGRNCEYTINSEILNTKYPNFISHFLHGLKLKSYTFNKYKTKKKLNNIKIIAQGKSNKSFTRNKLKFQAIEKGTFYTRDLVSEPGNVLHPDEYARRLKSLKKYGIKVNVYDTKQMKKLGMNALIGVGQGSIRGSYLVTMEERIKKQF